MVYLNVLNTQCEEKDRIVRLRRRWEGGRETGRETRGEGGVTPSRMRVQENSAFHRKDN